MPTTSTSVTLVDNGPAILNAIRNDSSLSFQERVPVATQETIKDYGNAVLSTQATQNEFLDALVNRIGKVIISSRLYNNPLKVLKKGMLDYGETIEEIYVNLAKAKIYDPDVAEDEFMKREVPDVQSIFHKLDYQNFFKCTIQRQDLELAFLSANGVGNLVDNIISQLYTGAYYDEFITVKQLIVEYAKKGLFTEVNINSISTQDDLTDAIATIKSYSNKMQFMSTKYNAMGVATYTDPSKMVYLIDSDFEAKVGVKVLAYAFNMEQAEFIGRRILIDDFADLTGAKLLLCDETFFQIYDVLLQFDSVRNPQGLYWNYYLHKWNVFSISRFSNAILFTTPENEITNINLSGGGSVVYTNLPKTFTIKANITSTGEVDNELIWSMTGNESANTTMSVADDTQSVTITVASTEVYPNTITIKAQSKYFTSVSGSATIKITTT